FRSPNDDRSDGMAILDHGCCDDTAVAEGPGDGRMLVFGVRIHFGDFFHGPAKDRASRYARATGPHRICIAEHLSRLRRKSLRCHEVDEFAVETEDMAETGSAEGCGTLGDRLEHRLTISGRSAYDVEYIANCSLILKRFL